LIEIKRFPMLDPEQECALAARWRQHEDREAALQLITSHLRLVAKIALRSHRYGLPMSEIVSEGNVGLMQALKRFDPRRGFRFATYAMWWIKASIQEYIMRSWSLVKLGAGADQKKLFFNLRLAKRRILAIDGGELRPDQVKQIAAHLHATERDVIEIDRQLAGDLSLNIYLRDDGDGQWQDWLVDDQDDPEHKLAESEELSIRHEALVGSLGVLNPRERHIIEARRLADDPMTLEDLSSELGVTRERVRQIEARHDGLRHRRSRKTLRAPLELRFQDVDAQLGALFWRMALFLRYFG
jgi:RNA polymerase sigma-32 factor